MKRFISIAPSFVFYSSFLFAQDSIPSEKFFINAGAHYGFIAAHRQNMDYLIKRHVPAGELYIVQTTNGKKYWEKVYKNPEKGLGFYLAELGNPQQLGQAIGIFPFVNFPLNPGRKFKLFLRAGDGLGIITKPFERTKNHKNNINGSYLNEFIFLRLNSLFYPAKNVRMETGIGLTHLSNGNWAVPNLGINIITLNMGLSLHHYPSSTVKQQVSNDTTYRNINLKPFFTIVASAGPNELSYRNGKKYGDYALLLYGWKPVAPKSRFSAGVDALYGMGNLARAEKDSIFDTSNKLNNLQLGARLGYELVVEKFAIPIEMGAYFFSKTTINGPWYHRVGLRYYMNKHIILNYTLKTHWAIAENIEFGIGYKF